MAEIPIPEGYGVPLVDLDTKKLPDPTMTAIRNYVATEVDAAATAAAGSASDASTSATAAEDAKTAAETVLQEIIVPVSPYVSISGAHTITEEEAVSEVRQYNLTGDVDLTIEDGPTDQACSLLLFFQQDATGSRDVTLINVTTPEGVAIPWTPNANAVDILSLLWAGGAWHVLGFSPNHGTPATYIV